MAKVSTTDGHAAGTHPWFGHAGPLPGRRLNVSDLKQALRHELRDCSSLLKFEDLAVQPLVAARDAYDELFTAARGLLALLHRAVVESGATSVDRCHALAIEESSYPIFGSDEQRESRYCAVMARPDVMIGADGPKFIEFNVSGSLGGPVETSLFTRAWKTIYGGADAAPFDGTDPLAVRAELYRKVCADLGLPPAVAVVGSARVAPDMATPRYFEVQAASMRAAGLRSEFFEPEDLVAGLGLPATSRYRVLHKAFTVQAWRELGIGLDPVHQAVQSGCVLFPPESCYLVANKKVMAWISEGLPWMNEADRSLVRRYLPWTRIVEERKVEWRGDTHDLGDLLVRHQEDLVLKKATGMMGLEVTLGLACAPDAWAAEAARALADGDTIVQEYVGPGRYRLETSDGSGDGTHPADVIPVLSPCLFDGRAGGCFVRYRRSGQAGVIGASRFGAVENVMVAAR